VAAAQHDDHHSTQPAAAPCLREKPWQQPHEEHRQEATAGHEPSGQQVHAEDLPAGHPEEQLQPHIVVALAVAELQRLLHQQLQLQLGAQGAAALWRHLQPLGRRDGVSGDEARG